MERLKAQNPDLKDRVTDRDATIEELTEFKKFALSRLAAQHVEIMRCAVRSRSSSRLHPPTGHLPRARTTVYGTCS
ncbi:hypothetical protein [Streptomyces mirabilis]|uniref:hypothetical protein n=1 Tax=Streptomyces mirabilis TaxID=68239 RepID=UPI0036DCE248